MFSFVLLADGIVYRKIADFMPFETVTGKSNVIRCFRWLRSVQ